MNDMNNLNISEGATVLFAKLTSNNTGNLFGALISKKFHSSSKQYQGVDNIILSIPALNSDEPEIFKSKIKNNLKDKQVHEANSMYEHSQESKLKYEKQNEKKLSKRILKNSESKQIRPYFTLCPRNEFLSTVYNYNRSKQVISLNDTDVIQSAILALMGIESNIFYLNQSTCDLKSNLDLLALPGNTVTSTANSFKLFSTHLLIRHMLDLCLAGYEHLSDAFYSAIKCIVSDLLHVHDCSLNHLLREFANYSETLKVSMVNVIYRTRIHRKLIWIIISLMFPKNLSLSLKTLLSSSIDNQTIRSKYLQIESWIEYHHSKDGWVIIEDLLESLMTLSKKINNSTTTDIFNTVYEETTSKDWFVSANSHMTEEYVSLLILKLLLKKVSQPFFNTLNSQIFLILNENPSTANDNNFSKTRRNYITADESLLISSASLDIEFSSNQINCCMSSAQDSLTGNDIVSYMLAVNAWCQGRLQIFSSLSLNVLKNLELIPNMNTFVVDGETDSDYSYLFFPSAVHDLSYLSDVEKEIKNRKVALITKVVHNVTIWKKDGFSQFSGTVTTSESVSRDEIIFDIQSVEISNSASIKPDTNVNDSHELLENAALVELSNSPKPILLSDLPHAAYVSSEMMELAKTSLYSKYARLFQNAEFRQNVLTWRQRRLMGKSQRKNALITLFKFEKQFWSHLLLQKENHPSPDVGNDQTIIINEQLTNEGISDETSIVSNNYLDEDLKSTDHFIAAEDSDRITDNAEYVNVIIPSDTDLLSQLPIDYDDSHRSAINSDLFEDNTLKSVSDVQEISHGETDAKSEFHILDNTIVYQHSSTASTVHTAVRVSQPPGGNSTIDLSNSSYNNISKSINQSIQETEFPEFDLLINISPKAAENYRIAETDDNNVPSDIVSNTNKQDMAHNDDHYLDILKSKAIQAVRDYVTYNAQSLSSDLPIDNRTLSHLSTGTKSVKGKNISMNDGVRLSGIGLLAANSARQLATEYFNNKYLKGNSWVNIYDLLYPHQSDTSIAPRLQQDNDLYELFRSLPDALLFLCQMNGIIELNNENVDCSNDSDNTEYQHVYWCERDVFLSKPIDLILKTSLFSIFSLQCKLIDYATVSLALEYGHILHHINYIEDVFLLSPRSDDIMFVSDFVLEAFIDDTNSRKNLQMYRNDSSSCQRSPKILSNFQNVSSIWRLNLINKSLKKALQFRDIKRSSFVKAIDGSSSNKNLLKGDCSFYMLLNENSKMDDFIQHRSRTFAKLCAIVDSSELHNDMNLPWLVENDFDEEVFNIYGLSDICINYKFPVSVTTLNTMSSEYSHYPSMNKFGVFNGDDTKDIGNAVNGLKSLQNAVFSNDVMYLLNMTSKRFLELGQLRSLTRLMWSSQRFKRINKIKKSINGTQINRDLCHHFFYIRDVIRRVCDFTCDRLETARIEFKSKLEENILHHGFAGLVLSVRNYASDLAVSTYSYYSVSSTVDDIADENQSIECNEEKECEIDELILIFNNSLQHFSYLKTYHFERLRIAKSGGIQENTDKSDYDGSLDDDESADEYLTSYESKTSLAAISMYKAIKILLVHCRRTLCYINRLLQCYDDKYDRFHSFLFENVTNSLLEVEKFKSVLKNLLIKDIQLSTSDKSHSEAFLMYLI